jgi:hypothetical protein
MNIRTFINILISLLVVFIIFNLIVPYAAVEGFTEVTTSQKAAPQLPATTKPQK